MRLVTGAVVAFVVLAGHVRAGEKLVMDLWDAAYMEGGKAGYIHTMVAEHERGERKLFQATVQLNLTVKRFQQTIQLQMDTGTIEAEDGKVIGTFMRQYLGRGKMLEVTGAVVGNELRLTQDRTVALKPAPWDEKVAGLYKQQRMFAEKKVKPGDEFVYRSFEPSINVVISTTVKVKDFEDVEIFSGFENRKLLRVESWPEKIQNVQLPPLVSWLDDKYETIRSQVEIPGLGKILLYRAPKEVATAPGAVATLTDIGIKQYVKLKQRITRPYDATHAVYRIKVKGDDDPASTFSKDSRQAVLKTEGDTIELDVSGTPLVEPGADGVKPGGEYLASSYFINSDDAQVRKIARLAVGSERDPWRKTMQIVQWVNRNMKSRSHEAMATADHVARTLQGDCSEYAMLTAAMCRAENVPARTAIGLIYADSPEVGPVFSFHMWAEVFVSGKWYPVDATLGRGFVGATHLKITDQSWHEVRSLTPLFPVVRVLGRLEIEVLRAETARQ